MFARIVSTLALVTLCTTAVTATALPSQPTAANLKARDVQADSIVALTKRCGGSGGCGCNRCCWGCGCGGHVYGGYGGIDGFGGYGGMGGYGVAGLPYV
ncbi:hypothetical protein IWW39_000920 [Coemansia spiralis]|uniref:Uncharacterized protein n=1 Tax=Coemansia spiralis TaxID=417178 RepID=A0A9W8GQZ0_9FUNG|nr:hypothetical protein IWW39_000920 [Coemansia spiralis]